VDDNTTTIIWGELDTALFEFKDRLSKDPTDPAVQVSRGKCLGIATALGIITNQSIEDVLKRAAARSRGA
jgi:hypothetical protein